jgi:Helitron helicase-like domain at N-terminus
MGTDESCTQIWSQIWSTSVMQGPPSLWLTINPSDIHNPIAQIFVEHEINMDNFLPTDGPDASNHALNIAADPYMAAKFFHFTVMLVLQTLMGIEAGKGNNCIQRKEGVVGKVSAYIGMVEAQGRGTLHLHMILWLENAPTLTQMKESLCTDALQKQVTAYIRAAIHADLDGAIMASEVIKIKQLR